MVPWAPLALTGVTTALLAVPVTPALIELRRRRDAVPLPTTRHDARITNFADSFYTRLEPLRPQLELCRLRREILRIHDERGDVVLVGCEDFDFGPHLLRGVSAVMFGGPAQVPAARVIEADIYAENLQIGKGTAIRAALSAGDAILEPESAVLRWLHARGNVWLREGSSVYGRISADQSVILSRGCSFERLHAPRIIAVSSDDQGLLDALEPYQEVGQENSGADNTLDCLRRVRVQGDFILPAGETMYANVIATGDVRIAAGAQLFGNAKSYRHTFVEEDARIDGSLVCGQSVRLDAKSFVRGPVTAEKNVLMMRGSRIGSAEAPSTLSATHISISPGCQLHGTIWARAEGRIEE
jgi:cytoskeletal protein CcmA (bactofilin family)